jgi:hypothetical protein
MQQKPQVCQQIKGVDYKLVSWNSVIHLKVTLEQLRVDLEAA